VNVSTYRLESTVEAMLVIIGVVKKITFSVSVIKRCIDLACHHQLIFPLK
jgi:hypothetical protein